MGFCERATSLGGFGSLSTRPVSAACPVLGGLGPGTTTRRRVNLGLGLGLGLRFGLGTELGQGLG